MCYAGIYSLKVKEQKPCAWDALWNLRHTQQGSTAFLQRGGSVAGNSRVPVGQEHGNLRLSWDWSALATDWVCLATVVRTISYHTFWPTCREYASHNLEEGKGIAGHTKKARGTVPEYLQHRRKPTITSAVPEGDLNCMVTVKTYQACSGKTCSSGVIASPWQ